MIANIGALCPVLQWLDDPTPLGSVDVSSQAQWFVKRSYARRTGAACYSTSSRFDAVRRPLYEPPEGPKPEIPCRRCDTLKDMSIPALSRLAPKPLALAEHAKKRQQNLVLRLLLFDRFSESQSFQIKAQRCRNTERLSSRCNAELEALAFALRVAHKAAIRLR